MSKWAQIFPISYNSFNIIYNQWQDENRERILFSKGFDCISWIYSSLVRSMNTWSSCSHFSYVKPKNPSNLQYLNWIGEKLLMREEDSCCWIIQIFFYSSTRNIFWCLEIYFWFYNRHCFNQLEKRKNVLI